MLAGSPPGADRRLCHELTSCAWLTFQMTFANVKCPSSLEGKASAPLMRNMSAQIVYGLAVFDLLVLRISLWDRGELLDAHINQVDGARVKTTKRLQHNYGFMNSTKLETVLQKNYNN